MQQRGKTAVEAAAAGGRFSRYLQAQKCNCTNCQCMRQRSWYGASVADQGIATGTCRRRTCRCTIVHNVIYAAAQHHCCGGLHLLRTLHSSAQERYIITACTDTASLHAPTPPTTETQSTSAESTVLSWCNAAHLSTAAAASRPSLMAHTTRLWPRLQSPAANTPGMDVANSPHSACRQQQQHRNWAVSVRQSSH
jgi:hypothetical protein